MFLWLIFALLAGAVASLLIRFEPSADEARTGDPDLAVYRDQLAEISADVDRGVLTEAEAASARTEVARRLLKAAGPGHDRAESMPPLSPATGSGPAAQPVTNRTLIAAAAAIPIACLGVYLMVGSPGLPGRPLAERLAASPATASTDELIAKVEARLREQPGDGMGWSVLAPVYLSQGRFVDAGRAYERAIALLGETPERLAGIAKALVLANDGVIVEPARAAYQRLLALDPGRPEARFWLAIYDEQNGRLTEATAALRAMLADAPADAPWRTAVEDRLAAIAAGGPAIPPMAARPSPAPAAASAPASPGPSASAPGPAPAGAPVLAPVLGAKPAGAGPTPSEFVTAAARLPAEMREQMLGRMIARAEDVLKSAPADAAAWSRLVTGLTALGRSPEATDALKRAKSALAADPPALAELDALGRSLGLSS